MIVTATIAAGMQPGTFLLFEGMDLMSWMTWLVVASKIERAPEQSQHFRNLGQACMHG